MENNLIHEVMISKGYDFRNRKPNYGQHPPEILFIVKGNEGAVVLQVNTGWYLDGSCNKPWTQLVIHEALYRDPHADLDTIRDHCDIIGEACISRIISSRNELWLEGLLTSGSQWVWNKLDAFYNYVYHNMGAPDLTPEPMEFPKEYNIV